MMPEFWRNPAWYDTSRDSNGLNRAIIDGSRKLWSDWSDYHRELPKTLYHYTSATGLIGILNSSRLWATHVGFLNDTSELLYASELINSLIVERQSEANNEWQKMLLERAILGINAHFQEFCVTCFCEEGDLLSQWRAYGSAGGGYAIGFDANQIGSRYQPHPSFSMRRIIYDRERQVELVNNTLDVALELLYSQINRTQDKKKEWVVITILSFLHDIFDEYQVTFKSALFAEEREWRIVRPLETYSKERVKSGELQFRQVSGVPVAYLSLDLSPSAGNNHDRLPVNSIRHGPTLHPELAAKALEVLIRNYGFHASVLSSGVPLRY